MTMRAYSPPIEAGERARVRGAVAGTLPARRAIAHSALWLLASNVFYSACQWLTVVALVKSHAPNALGHYGLASAVAAPIVVLSTMALRSYQATDVLRRYAFADYLNLRLAANVLAATAIGLTAWAGAVPDAAVSVLIPIGLAKLAEVTSETCYGLAQRHERIRLVALSQGARAAVGLGALVAVLTFDGTLAAAVWALAAAWTAVLLMVDLPAAQSMEPVLARPNVARLVSLARDCVPLGLQSAVVALTQGLPRYLLQASHGAAAVGYFTALSGVTPALGQLASAVGHAAAPQLGWKAAGDMRSYRRLVFKLLGAAAALSVALTFGSVLVGRQFLTVAYTADYAAHQTAFVLLVLAAGLSMVNTMAFFSMLAVRRHGLMLAIQCGGLLTTALTGAWLIPRFGLNGAAVAVALGGAAIAAPGAHVLLRGQASRVRGDRLVRTLVVLLLTGGLGTSVLAAEPVDGRPGIVRFTKGAASSFDRYTRDPSPAQQQWMRTRYWRDLRRFAAGDDPSGLDSPRRPGEPPLHPLRLRRWHLPPVRRRHRQSGLPGRLDRRRAGDARQGLRRALRRRREHGSLAGRERRERSRGPAGPAHGRRHDEPGLATLHGRVHGGDPTRLPDPRDRAQRALVLRLGRPLHPAPAPERRLHRGRAGRERRRRARRQRQVRLRPAARLSRLAPRQRQGHRLRRGGGDRRGARVRARGVLSGRCGA
jgi:O-antigen/teichoic acid export membrane protein